MTSPERNGILLPFVQQYIEANIKENIKALHYWPKSLCGGDRSRWIPAQNASNTESVSMSQHHRGTCATRCYMKHDSAEDMAWTQLIKSVDKQLHSIDSVWCNYLSLRFIPAYIPTSQIARFMGPPWGPPGSCRSQVGPIWPHEPCYQGYIYLICKL